VTHKQLNVKTESEVVLEQISSHTLLKR